MLIIINIMSTAPRKRLFCPRSIKSSISLSCPFASLYSTRYVHLLNQITPPGMCTYSSSNHWGQDVDYGPAKLQRIFSASKVDKKLVFCTLKGVCRNFPLHLYYLYILCPTPPLNERKRRKKATLSLFSSFWHGNSCGAIWPGALSPFSWMGQPGPQCCAGETLVFES